MHAGSSPTEQKGAVNPPIYRASTVLFATLAALEESVHLRNEPGHFHYGRFGTPTSHALEEALASLEGGDHGLALPSGVAAIATTLLAHCGSGDHLLMVDSVYGPIRGMCNTLLRRLGIETEFYNPRIGAGIARLIRPSTKLVYLESPGSLTLEIQDLPAIAAAAHAGGALVAFDNTWGTPLFHNPLALGADIVIQAATKYIVGHSDAMLGTLVMRKDNYMPLRLTATALGYCVSADDCYLGLRGLRTLAVRLQRHQETGLVLARWLQSRPEVSRVIHPALPDHPDHPLWLRDFRGACGLFAVELKPCRRAALEAMLNGLRLFGMGFSWGGFESLILPCDPTNIRTAVPWPAGAGPLLRIHAGLEDPADLISDLEAGFKRLAAADGDMS
ncbi:MAG TPA: cystathionine beta-lyase [Woeseiaceae bacterium]|nr:cystathionine beta-lyase [Woeseiaceae bacterium]